MKPMPLLVLAALVSCASAPMRAQTPPSPAPAADTERQLEAARQRLDVAAREVAELSAKLGEDMGQRFLRRGAMLPRAVLGVQIEAKAGVGGATVLAISPGGAAAAAGIEAGDVITAINGEDLSKVSEPSRALVERMRGLQPDSKVKLKVMHAGKSRDVEVTARAPEPGLFGMGGPGGPGGPDRGRAGDLRGPPGMAGMPPRQLIRERRFERGMPGEGPPMPPGHEGMPPWMGAHRRLEGLELASLSPRLGGYFGAKAGVLVVRAGNADLKLEDGDVITSIDGREPTSASHATRILMSYGRGEKVVIKVLRDRKAVQLDATIGAK